MEGIHMKTTVFKDGEKFYEAGNLKVSIGASHTVVTIQEMVEEYQEAGEVNLYVDEINHLINALLDIKREAINAGALK
jgi:hypothetical protein